MIQELAPWAVALVGAATGLGALYAAIKRVPPPSGLDAYEAARKRAAEARAKRNPL